MPMENRPLLLLEDGAGESSSSNFHQIVLRDRAPLHRYVIDRATHTEENFKEQVAGPELQPEQPTLAERARNCMKRCNRTAVENAILRLLPILTWIRHYDVRKWLPGDVVSGITVGVVHIPQSLAFSFLAGLPPVFGLYTSFYPVLIYTLMGTSRHISVGTFAVTSLLTQAVVVRLVPDQTGNATQLVVNATATIDSTELDLISDTDARKVVVASTLMFLMGVFQLAFGILRFGFITSYLSEPLIQAFTTGAALQVVTSQTPILFGITIQSSSGIGSLFQNWIEIFKTLPSTNVPTLVVSIVCFVLLIAGREINLRYKEKMKLPLPTEVIVVIIATLASHFGMFQQNFQVRIVDNIPTGIPPPQLPDFSILQEIVGDAFSVAIVGFAISVSLAKLYAQKHEYCIDSNQELVAYGVSNIVPSFFSCFPNAASLARCVIQDNTGGNTQIVGAIATVIVLITILVLGPVFEPLPRCVLSSIIVVGLFGIIMQLSVLKTVYKQSRLDFLVWIVTLLAVVVLGVSLGLLASVIFALFTVIARTQLPHYEVLGSVRGTDVYRNCNSFNSIVPYKGIVIFKFYSSLYYANKDNFKQKLIKACGVDPDLEVIRRKEQARKTGGNEEQQSTNYSTQPDANGENGGKHPDVSENNTICCESRPSTDELPHTIIIDCSAISFVDLVGTKALKGIHRSFKKINIRVLLANVSCDVRCSLSKISYYDEAGSDSEFITIHDAALFALGGEPDHEIHDRVVAETTRC